MSKPVTLIAFAALSLTTALPAAAQDKPPTSRLVELGVPHVAKRGNGHVLVQTVTTTSGSTKDKFWALVELTGPDGSRRCEWHIRSVRWEPLPNDIANHWVVIQFTDGEGKDEGVAFRDGGRMGNRGSTGPIYLAVRKAARK